MPREFDRPKTLKEHLRDGTFGWSRHKNLLQQTSDTVAHWESQEAAQKAASVELAKLLGYEEAAARLGITASGLYARVRRQGASSEVNTARGRMSKVAVDKAAVKLGVSSKTIQNMRRDGRLPLAFTDEDVQSLRTAWALVPYALTADEASRWDPAWKRCLACLSYFKIRRNWALQGRGLTCSIECREAWRKINTAPNIVVIKVRSEQPPKARRFYAGACATCGSHFHALRASGYCSDKCARKAGKRRRKAVERGALVVEVVSTERLLERDRYRCHICKGKVDPELHKTDPRHPQAASKDHIQPLSFGGVESYDNVKLAHYGCNASRGNRDQFQMRLPVAA